MTLPDGSGDSCLNDITFIHNSLPEMAVSDISLKTTLCDIALEHPLIINALTGGNDAVTAINEKLAVIAVETAAPMAVGSQYGAVKTHDAPDSFKIVRKINPNGIILANLSAKAPIYFVEKAINMIEANILQIHLNPAQEFAMAEGDRDFTGYLKNIEQICRISPVPVIVKETGCGISKAIANKLIGCGVKGIDISGAGGTDFIAIEAARNSDDSLQPLFGWGIPTAVSVSDVYQVTKFQTSLIASGGIRTGLDMAKSLALGADACAMAGNIITMLLTKNSESVIQYLNDSLLTLKRVMLLVGSASITDLRKSPLLFTGKYLDYLEILGYNPILLAKSR